MEAKTARPAPTEREIVEAALVWLKAWEFNHRTFENADALIKAGVTLRTLLRRYRAGQKREVRD